MKKHVSMVRFSEHISDILSYGGLVLCIVVFSILSQGRLFNAYNIKILVQAVCVYAIDGYGGDIYLFDGIYGYQRWFTSRCLLYSFCIVVTNKTGSLLAGFLTILALSLICGLINGYVAVMLGLPSIVTSIFLMSIFGGAQLLIMEKLAINSISIEYDMTFFKSTEFMIFVIVVIALISIYLYNYTQLGEYVKSIGANALATSYSGVKTVKWKVLAYVFFGICVAVGAFMLTARTGSAGQGTGTGYAMDIMVALLLGGMPLSGGMKSKMSSSLIGSFTYVILSNGLNLQGKSWNIHM